jgi:transposase-like protein
VRSSKYLNNMIEQAHQAADPTDARLQTVRQRGSDDQRHRAYAENSEASI